MSTPARQAAALLATRVSLGVPVAVAATAGVFALAAHSPFDPVTAYLGVASERATPEAVDAVTRLLGVDLPWWRHFTAWLAGLPSGDLGQSIAYRAPVGDVVADRLPWTALLVALGMAVAAAAAVPSALVAVRRPDGPLARSVTATATLLASTPPFVVSLTLVGVFSLALGVARAGGLTDPGQPVSAHQVLAHLPLPVAATALAHLPVLALHLRESLLAALATEPVRAARHRGLSDGAVLLRHALPVSLLPFVAVLGQRVPEVVAGAVVVEAVFGWPGLGQAVVAAATSVDYALLATLTALSALAVVLATASADIATLFLDPRTGRA